MSTAADGEVPKPRDGLAEQSRWIGGKDVNRPGKQCGSIQPRSIKSGLVNDAGQVKGDEQGWGPGKKEGWVRYAG